MWHESGFFSDIIGGRLWRNELYPIYYNPFRRIDSDKGIAFVLERTCCAIFGLVTYVSRIDAFKTLRAFPFVSSQF